MTLRARKLSAIANLIKRCLSMLGVFTFACSGAYGAESTADAAISNKIKILNESYAKRAEKVYRDSTSKTSTLTVQEIGNTALYFCMSQTDPSKIEHLLRTEFGAQMMDDTFPSFGQLPSRINSPKITNNNSLELGCQALGPILIGYDNGLSPDKKMARTTFKSSNDRAPQAKYTGQKH
jgi:hypothetical protein